jgi:S-adenosylmethionine decarboxylase
LKEKKTLKFLKIFAISASILFSSILATEAKEPAYWGYHLILDCKSCDIDKIASAQNIKDFLKTLVHDIDMKAYGEPIIEHFAADNPKAAGFSCVQLIETSAITGHFVNENGDCYLDIFSCKKYDVEIVKKIVKQYFNPKSLKEIYITRQA